MDSEVPCITVVWKRYATSAQLRYVHEQLLCLLGGGGVAVLGDDTQLPTIHREDQRWIAENWWPRARSHKPPFRVPARKPAAMWQPSGGQPSARRAPARSAVQRVGGPVHRFEVAILPASFHPRDIPLNTGRNRAAARGLHWKLSWFSATNFHLVAHSARASLGGSIGQRAS